MSGKLCILDWRVQTLDSSHNVQRKKKSRGEERRLTVLERDRERKRESEGGREREGEREREEGSEQMKEVRIKCACVWGG